MLMYKTAHANYFSVQHENVINGCYWCLCLSNHLRGFILPKPKYLDEVWLECEEPELSTENLVYLAALLLSSVGEFLCV